MAALLAEFQNLPEKRAQQLTSRPLITVLKRASKEQAEQCRQKFKQIGISVRIAPAPPSEG